MRIVRSRAREIPPVLSRNRSLAPDPPPYPPPQGGRGITAPPVRTAQQKRASFRTRSGALCRPFHLASSRALRQYDLPPVVVRLVLNRGERDVSHHGERLFRNRDLVVTNARRVSNQFKKDLENCAKCFVDGANMSYNI